jgi:hypothetical protein
MVCEDTNHGFNYKNILGRPQDTNHGFKSSTQALDDES